MVVKGAYPTSVHSQEPQQEARRISRRALPFHEPISLVRHPTERFVHDFTAKSHIRVMQPCVNHAAAYGKALDLAR